MIHIIKKNGDVAYTTQFIQYWIGKPHNDLDEDFGEDGNTILVQIAYNTYVYICEEIYSFTSYASIVKYVSNIENSNIPYPFAIDENKFIYLMLDKNVITGRSPSTESDDDDDDDGLYNSPYYNYYDNFDNFLTKEMLNINVIVKSLYESDF